MDPTDMRIFCEISFKYLDYRAPIDRRVSPTEIGLKLGLDEKTVRLRVKKMEDDGFIKYYQAIPNFGLFGLGALVQYAFESGDVRAKHAAIQSLRDRRGIVEITDMLGQSFAATFAGPSAENVQQQAVKAADDFHLKRVTVISRKPLAEPTIVPNRLDWQIIRACRYDALCSSSDLAEKLSITPRMAEYRIGKLLESRAFFIKAMLDVQNQRGVFFYGLAVLVDEDRKASIIQDLKRLHGERLWSVDDPIPLKALLVPRRLSDKLLLMLAGKMWVVAGHMFAETAGEAEQALTRSLKLDGVKRGFVGVIKEWVEPRRPGWIEDLLQARIDSTAS